MALDPYMGSARRQSRAATQRCGGLSVADRQMELDTAVGGMQLLNREACDLEADASGSSHGVE